MKKQTIFSRILLPTMIVLLLLPPLSCLIFQHAAESYAYNEATRDLELLQQNIFPLVQKNFDSTSATEEITTSPEDGQNTERGVINRSEPVGNFLFEVASLMRKTNNDAKLMIFEAQMRVIYPRDDQERQILAPLAQDFAAYIQEHQLSSVNNAFELKSSDGHSYLINIYAVPPEFQQVKYVITYSAVSSIGSWIRSASVLVLIISFIFAILIFAVLWIAIRSITYPLHRLCSEAERIGSGSFSNITPEFHLKELEALRQSMNQMSDQLCQSDEIQRNFFQNVSHELRNPLMSISGYAQGIEQERFQSPKEAAHTILAESGRLTKLVNSLLTLSRMESDTSAPALDTISVIDTIEECLDRVNGLALKKQIHISLTPFDEKLCVYGNEELICKVLENLLTNAIRYAKTAVTVSVAEVKEQLCISVRDDGDGISEKDLPHLFERCYKGKNGNFGIGLAIARSAAQKMNGSLSAINSEAGGAVFTLWLTNSRQ